VTVAGIDLREYPGLVPGLVVTVLLALILRRRLGEVLEVHPIVAAAIVFASGLVISVTLTPGAEAIDPWRPPVEATTIGCDVDRVTPLPPAAFATITEASLNVYLLVPLGLVLAIVPRSRWRVGCIAAAFALPPLIETVQLVVPALGRACQSADVVDNWTGLILGVAVATVVRVTRGSRFARRSEQT
jgi:VanZ family protein